MDSDFIVTLGGICMGMWVIFFVWRYLSNSKKGEK